MTTLNIGSLRVIDSFRGSYDFLSNFYLEIDGSNVETKFQRSKCADWKDTHKFDGLTPGQAKRLGRKVNLRSDWEEVKLDVMHDLVLEKFENDPTILDKLLNTRDAMLIEGNDWGDTFWGQVEGIGENHLGKILIEVRKELGDSLGE